MKNLLSILERTFEYLIKKLGDSGINTQELLANGQLEVVEDDLIISQVIPAGAENIVELTDSTQPFEIGLVSLDKAKFPKSQHAAFSRCAFRYAGVTTALTTELRKVALKGADYSENERDAAGSSRIPSQLRNAILRIEVGGKTIFRKTVGTLTFNGRDQNSNQDGLYVLDIPRFIKAETEVRVFLELPKGVALPGTAGTDYHMVQFYAPVLTTTVRQN